MINTDISLTLISILGPITLFSLWFTLTNTGIIRPLYLPTPQSVGFAFLELKQDIFFHVFATTIRIIIGYIVGVTLGIGLGFLMSYNRYVYTFLNSIIESWRPVPPVALIPFFILWFGFSNAGKIVLVALGVALVMVVSTFESIRNVNPTYIQAAYSLGATKKKVFSSVILSAVLPHVRSGLRISLALAISLVVVSEFLGADRGIGYLINISKVTFNTPAILLGILILGLLSFILDSFLQLILARMTSWSEQYSESLEEKYA